jgi:rRNA-processing protein FCF1
VDAVVDSSSLISLARAGLLPLLGDVPFEILVPEEVWQETVVEGIARGYPDAAGIESACSALERTISHSSTTADDAVVQAAGSVGLLIANDLALGRRARNVGAHWLRTGDIVVLLWRGGHIPRSRAVSAVVALRDAGRMAPALAGRLLDEMEESDGS